MWNIKLACWISIRSKGSLLFCSGYSGKPGWRIRHKVTFKCKAGQSGNFYSWIVEDEQTQCCIEHTHTLVKCGVIFDKRHLLTAIFFNLGFVDMQRQTIKDNATCPQSDTGVKNKSSLVQPTDVNSVLTELSSSGKDSTSTG